MDEELIKEFLAETQESLEILDSQIIELEKNPNNEVLLNNIFRVMHNIKGTCGFLNFDKLKTVAHAGENIMDRIRHKEIPINQEKISAILSCLDVIKEISEFIKNNGFEPKKSYQNLVDLLNKHSEIQANEIKAAVNADNVSQDKVSIKKLSKEINQENTLKTDLTQDAKGDANLVSNSLVIPQTIHVSVEVLENLMEIVSELVLSRNQLLQLDQNLRDVRFTPPVQRLNIITTALQETVMETRMQPIKNAWNKVPRMIRDLMKSLDKKINLEMIGEDTELDRQLIETIRDPLTHMIRNAADHGLESTAERAELGKPLEGKITLKAYHQGGHIFIEVSDDGRGINITKIKDKIIKNKLVNEVELSFMSEAQIMNFIFAPGFSTAEKITEISGRGVGLDVVKTNIEKIRGTVDFKSTPGKGSVFLIKIPLTLAIMPVLIVECFGQKFGIPQINVSEMVRTGGMSNYIIEDINENRILRLREKLLPLITLAEILLPNQVKSKELDENKKAYYIVICEVSGYNFGLIVDKIFDTEEIVLKPVSRILEYIDAYSGNTLLGNGEVIMIIDPTTVIKHLSPSAKSKAARLQEIRLQENLSNFLVVKTSNSLKAVSLEIVSRLEEIKVSEIEYTDGKMVIQYRNSLMYLINLDPDYVLPKEGIQQVVVFHDMDHVVGIIIEEIIDVIEDNLALNSAFEDSEHKSIILKGKTMDLIDVSLIFYKTVYGEKAYNDLVKDKKEAQAELVKKAKLAKKSSKQLKDETQSNKITQKIAYIDDSMFFRKVLPSSLTDEGFYVESFESAKVALEHLKNNFLQYKLIITDINMPEMDGFELARFCLNHEDFKSIPIIALTSNIEGAERSPKFDPNLFTAFLSKNNQYELIKIAHQILDRKDK